MVDKLFVNKLAAALILALMVVKLGEFIGDMLVKPMALKTNSYVVANVTPEGGASSEKSPPPSDANAALPPIMPLLASADGHQGEDVAKKCLACHTLTKGGPNRVGPNLWGVLGRKTAAAADYSYSSALQAQKDKIWDYDRLNNFLAAPQKFAPGTKMTFAGLAKAEDRANIIIYLRGLADSPMALPK